MESYTLASLPQVFRTLISSFLSGLFRFVFLLRGSGGGGEITEAFNVSHSSSMSQQSPTPTKDFLAIATSGSPNHGLPHGLWWHHRPQTSTQSRASTHTTDFNTACVGTVDYADLSRRLNPESELFVISDILPWLRVRVILLLGNVFGSRSCVFSRLVFTILPVLLGNNVLLRCSLALGTATTTAPTSAVCLVPLFSACVRPCSAVFSPVPR